MSNYISERKLHAKGGGPDPSVWVVPGKPPLTLSPLQEAGMAQASRFFEEMRQAQSGQTAAEAAPESQPTAVDELEAMLMQGSVTPELILYILHARMNDLNGQLMEAIGHLDEKTNDAEAVNRKLQAALALQGTELQDNKPNIGMDEQVKWDGKWISARQLIDDEGLDAIPLNENDQIDGDTLRSHIDRLQRELDSHNSGNELAMVGIQNLTQQRAQILSMGSNLLKTLGEQQESIIRNLG